MLSLSLWTADNRVHRVDRQEGMCSATEGRLGGAGVVMKGEGVSAVTDAGVDAELDGDAVDHTC